MTKTKKSVFAGFTALSMVCCLAGGVLIGGGALTARADSWDQTGGETGNDIVTLPGNTTKTELTTKAVAKIAAVNEQITAATTGDNAKSLAEAYADGDILVYSTASDDGLLEAGSNARSNWKTWDGIPLVDLQSINEGYTGWGGNIGCLSYDGLSKEVYVVAGKFANDYYGNGKKMGPAVSDAFILEGVRYQNFAGGYMKLNGNNVEETYGKNIDKTNGTEISANPKGFVGVANDAIAAVVSTDNAGLYEAFNAAYDKYTEQGINVGYPFHVVKQEGDITLQHFRYGDSIRDPYGQNDRKEWAYLAYSVELEEAILMQNEFVNGDGADGIKKLGSPVSEEFTVNGNRYINFEKGYAMAEGTTPQNKNATVVEGKNVNEITGLEETLDEQGKIGKLGKAVADNLPEGVSATELSQAFKDAYASKVEEGYYDGEELKSVDLVTYENGLLVQTYTDNNDQKHQLVYVDGNIYYLRPIVVSKKGGLGAPTGERILVAKNEDAGKEVYAYPFENGYVRLTVQQEDKFEGGDFITVKTDLAVAMSGAEFDSDKVFFETLSYSDRITVNIVDTTETLKNGKSKAEYWTLWGVDPATPEELAAAFKKAYDDAFALGFSAGQLSNEGIKWWDTGNSYVIILTAKGGNGTANFWDDNTLMTYNPIQKRVYLSTGVIADGLKTGAAGNGWATTEMLVNTETGDIVQQFYIVDPGVPEGRPTYVISQGGETAQRVEGGTYDFGDESKWVPYLTQFGGSITQNPFNEAAKRNEGDKVEIDFAKYVSNPDGYTITWNKVSGKGTLSEDGKYTLDAMTAEDDVVEVEVYSAFDKLTFKITLTTSDNPTTNPDPTNPDPTNPDPTNPDPTNPDPTNPDPTDPDPTNPDPKKDDGLSTGAIAGICIGVIVAVGAIAALVYFLIKKKRK